MKAEVKLFNQNHKILATSVSLSTYIKKSIQLFDYNDNTLFEIKINSTCEG